MLRSPGQGCWTSLPGVAPSGWRLSRAAARSRCLWRWRSLPARRCAQTSTRSGSRAGPACSDATPPASATVLCRPSRCYFAIRPTAVVSAKRRSPRPTPAGGSPTAPLPCWRSAAAPPRRLSPATSGSTREPAAARASLSGAPAFAAASRRRGGERHFTPRLRGTPRGWCATRWRGSPAYRYASRLRCATARRQAHS